MAISESTISGIYQIRNLVNGKVYVGSAVNFGSRWQLHRSLLARGKHHSVLLQRSWDKHGPEKFVFEIIEMTILVKENLLLAEQKWIDRLRAADPMFGYNVCTVAGSTLGIKATPEAKAKMSEKRKGKKRSPESVEKGAAKMRGVPKTPDHIAKIKETHTPERRAQTAEANRNRVVSPETREKMAAYRRGTKLTQETKDKISKMGSGRRHTAQHVANHKASIARNKKHKPCKGQQELRFSEE